MKKVNHLSAVTLFLMFAGISVTAQISETAKSSMYDAELAKKLGANEMGLRNYVLAILKTGPNDAKIQGDERNAAFKGHFENMSRLVKEGKLAVAGPSRPNDKAFRGLFIFAVATVEEAQKLAESDPAVTAGILIVEYLPWLGSASLMATPEIHKKIAKTNP